MSNKFVLVAFFAVVLACQRYRISKFERSKSRGSLIINSSQVEFLDQYEFFDREKQRTENYLEFKHTVFKNGSCGDLKIPPLKRRCTPFLHFHPKQREIFRLVQGHLGYRLGEKIFTCDRKNCSSTIVIEPGVSHTFWMDDNKEDLVLFVRVDPIFNGRGLSAAAFENVAGTRRDDLMNLWQALLFIDRIETYPSALPLFFSQVLTRFGSMIASILGYHSEYDEYTTRF